MPEREEAAARLRAAFTARFPLSSRKLALVRSPGRVNIIGEHTDYNEGYVFPAAVDRCTYVAAQRRTDTKVSVYSGTVEEKVEFDIRILRFDQQHGWANYVKAVLHALVNRGWKLEGMNIYLDSDVPMGGGMSSSAALECAVAHACLALFPYQLDRVAMAKLCQRAENQFVGVACGIMDQFAANFGRKGQALFLDCRSLRFEHVRLPADRHLFLLVNSGVKRKLASAEYNKRREQCGEALKIIKEKKPSARALRDIEPAELPALLPSLPEVLRKRTEHVVRECARVKRAVEALKAADFAALGKLISESHASLKTLYEVSCPELDTLAESAQNTDGVLGARMMGGGFGGCVIALVDREKSETARREISRIYQRRYGSIPEAYSVQADDGAGELKP